ncbi:speckle-type POZ protein-like [Planococcus citri]|uniref:speckle-type POZ protein-like n=1 Tax=Planococcus citri TaxID=170843 RepID=UPI0031F97170
MEENCQLIIHKSCSTKPSDTVFNYLWEINQYRTHYDDSGTSLTSPEFSTPSNENHKWTITLKPRYHSEFYKLDFLSLSLKFTCVSGNDIETIARFQLSVLDSERRIAHSRRSAFREFKNIKEYFFETFIERDILLERQNTLLPDDKLSILCEITIRSETPTSTHQTCEEPVYDIIPTDLPPCTLLDDLSQLFENQEFCDVTICVKGEEFKAYKGILSARSAVFKAMFQHGMKESQNNRVEITDVEPEAFRELLRYVYTGNLKSTETVTLDLLVAANKYDLKRLKSTCENTLCKSLSNENAANALITADLHQAEKLKAAAILFIKSNPLAVMITEGWKNVLDNYPYLINDIKK